MPFVATADARNARLTKVPVDRLQDRATLNRVPLIASDSMRLVLLEMPSGHKTIPHRHPRASEYFFILAGAGVFKIGDGQPIVVVPGDLLYAQTDEVHAIEAGDSGLRFLAGLGPNEDQPDEEILARQAGQTSS